MRRHQSSMCKTPYFCFVLYLGKFVDYRYI
jgi:hypothetical protein